MSEPAVEEPIKAARRDSMDVGDVSAPDRFGARPQTEPGLASSLMSGMARTGAMAAGIKTAPDDSTEGDAQTMMGGANFLPNKVALNFAASKMGAHAPVVDLMRHAGIATKAAAHWMQEKSGHDASEVAHDSRAELGKSFDNLDATSDAWRAERAAKAAGQAPAHENLAMSLLSPGAKTVRGKSVGKLGKYLLGAADSKKKADAHGAAVMAEGYHAPTETTVTQSEAMAGYDVKRNAEGELVSKKSDEGIPQSTAEGKAAVYAAMPHRALTEIGGAIAGDDAEEHLRRGNFKTAMAKSVLGGGAAIGKQVAATTADAHGASGFGGALVAGASTLAGGLVKGVGSAIGSVTGVEKAAQRQEIAEMSENWYGSKGKRRAELMKGGMNARPKADGLNDEAAGMPDIDFAKEGESYTEGAAAADKSLKDSGWGEKGVWESTKEGFHKGVNWGDKNLNSNHSVAGTVLRAGSGLIAGAGHGLAAMGSKIVRHVGTFAGGVGGAAAGAWSKIKGHGGKLASGAWDKTKRGASWLGNKVAGGASAAWGGMKSAAGWLGDKFSGASDWLKSKLLTSVHHDRSEKAEDSD